MTVKIKSDRLAGAVLILAGLGLLTALYFTRPVSAQNNNEERRRGDLATLELPGGSKVEFSSLNSQALGGEQAFSIFTPPSFSKDRSRTYPVVFFLHGLNNDHTSWTVSRYGDLPGKVEQLILSGKIPEILLVNPKADNSFYCNTADGTRRYEDFVVREMISLVESRYRGRKGREDRAIAGTSMGGYGALKIAMKYPDLYSAVAGHSPIILLGKNPLDVPEEMKTARFFQFFVGVLKPIFGDPLRQELWDANNPVLLAHTAKLDHLRIFFDYGTEDRYIQSIRLDQGIKALDQALTEAKVEHALKIYPGEPHGWALVASHLDESLTFLCRDFKN
jgi:S-formylglutathione hydrolase FrmB